MFVKNQANQLVDLEIVRFPKPYHRRLRRLVSHSDALGDLLVSFPAAAFALVSGYQTADARGRAVSLVKQGASLKAVADALGLPVWLRKLPPEAFSEPLIVFPDDPGAARKFAHLVPGDPNLTGVWLDAVMRTCAFGDPVFAAWVAGHRQLYGVRHPLRRYALSLLAAYAWFSQNRNTIAAATIAKGWRRNQALPTVVAGASRWALSLIEGCQRVAPKRGPGRYSSKNAQAGFAIVALQTPADLFDEGRVMNHCVGTYAQDVASGRCLIFGVRINGQRVATMEVVGSVARGETPKIVQIEGPGNTKVAPAVAERARTWLFENASDPVSASDADPALALVDRRKWDAVWSPVREQVPAALSEDLVLGPSAVKTASMFLQALVQQR